MWYLLLVIVGGSVLTIVSSNPENYNIGKKDTAEHRELIKKKTNDYANYNKDQYGGSLVEKLKPTSASLKDDYRSQSPLQQLPHNHDAPSPRFEKSLKEHNPNEYSYALDENEPSHLRNDKRSHKPDYGRYTRQSNYYGHSIHNREPHLDYPGQTPDDFDKNFRPHHYKGLGGDGDPPPYNRGRRGGSPPSHYRGYDFEEDPPPYHGGPGKGSPHYGRPGFDEIPPPYHTGPGGRWPPPHHKSPSEVSPPPYHGGRDNGKLHHGGPNFEEDPPWYHRGPGGKGPSHHGRPGFDEDPPPYHRGPGKGPPHHGRPGFEEYPPPHHRGPGKGPPHHGRPGFEEYPPPHHRGPPPDHRGPPFHLHYGNPPQRLEPPHSSDNDQPATSLPMTSQNTNLELNDSPSSSQPPPRENQSETEKLPDSNNKKPLKPIDKNLPTVASVPDDNTTTRSSTTEEEFILDVRIGTDETEKPQQV